MLAPGAALSRLILQAVSIQGSHLANVAVPLIAGAIPAIGLICFPLIVAVEAAILRRGLGIGLWVALGLSMLANACSTVMGIPIVVVLMAILTEALGLREHTFLIPVATSMVLAVALPLSVLIERVVINSMGWSHPRLRYVCWQANLVSYSILFTIPAWWSIRGVPDRLLGAVS